VFDAGRKKRATHSTAMNSRSSRSHCLLCISVLGRNLITDTKTNGCLNLVDLAGSERVSKTNADGERLREARNINRSLACLGDVMHALRTRQQHVPYRNSKLTYLLQQSLGGNSKTLMIVQVAPGTRHVRETLCTLSFGMRVTTVELGQATRSTKLLPSDSACPAWRRPSDLDLSFSSTSSTCSSPFSSPSSSPCPSPSFPPSPSVFPFSIPFQPSFPSSSNSSSNASPLRRTVSTSSVNPTRQRQLPSPLRPSSFLLQPRPSPSPTQPRPSPSPTQPRPCKISSLPAFSIPATLSADLAGEAAEAAVSQWQAVITTDLGESPDSTPTTSRSTSPNGTPTTTPTSSPTPKRKHAIVPRPAAHKTSRKHGRSSNTLERSKSSASTARPLGDRWR
ncbi:kinesin-like protein, partial [Elysia marginata]